MAKKPEQPKSKYTMTNQDKLMFNNLAKTGRSQKETLNNYVGDARLKRMRQEGFIKMEKAYYKGQYVNTYILTDKGQKFVKQHIPEVKAMYKKVKGDGGHDLELSKVFTTLSREQQLAALTEGDMLKFYRGAKSVYSTPDLYIPAIEVNGVILEEQVIEITTTKYTKEQIEAKQRYCRDLLKTSNISFYKA